MERPNVISSVYSNSPPMDTPLAMMVILTSNGANFLNM